MDPGARGTSGDLGSLTLAIEGTTARRIREAACPILIVGSGANRPDVVEALESFVSRTGIHAVTTQMAKGALPEDHRHSLLCLAVHEQNYVHAAVEAADLMITAGYRIVEYPPAVWNGDGSKEILHIDQSAAAPDQRYGPCHELIGEIAHSFGALAEGLDGHRVDDPRFVKLAGFMRAKLWAEPAGEGARPDAIVAAVRRVLAVCGDGGFLMNSQDLETLAPLGLDLVVLILEDHEYGFIRAKQRDEGFARFEPDEATRQEIRRLMEA